MESDTRGAPKLPSIKDLRRKGYGKEVIDKIADVTSTSFCQDPWDSVTIPIVKPRGKAVIIHIHRTTLEDEDIFDVKLHSCDGTKCSHIICSQGCDISLKSTVKLVNSNELPKKVSVKNSKGSKFSFFKGTRPQTVASVPSLSTKTPFKKSAHKSFYNADMDGTIDFNEENEERTSKRKPSCVLYVYSGGRKRKVGFQLQPEIELFLARSLDKIESYTGKISCSSKRSLRKGESKERVDSKSVFLEKSSYSRREKSSELSPGLSNNETPNISRSSSGVSNPYVKSSSTEKHEVSLKEMSNEKHKKESRLKSSLKSGRNLLQEEEERCATLVCVPESCNCQKSKRCVVSMNYEDYIKASDTTINPELVDSYQIKEVYQTCPSHGDYRGKFSGKVEDPFSMDSLSPEEKCNSIGHLNLKDYQRIQNKFHDRKSVIENNSIHVRNNVPHWKHDNMSLRKSSINYCVPETFCKMNDANKIPDIRQSLTSSEIQQCPIHKNPTEDSQKNVIKTGNKNFSKMYKSFPYCHHENHSNTHFINPHESACNINHKCIDTNKCVTNSKSEMQFIERNADKQYFVRECCQLNKQPVSYGYGEVKMSEKYSVKNKNERPIHATEDQNCFMNAEYCDMFGDNISLHECLCGSIPIDMACGGDSGQDCAIGCCRGGSICETESYANSGGITNSTKYGPEQVCNYHSIEESNVVLRNGVSNKISYFPLVDSQSCKQKRIPNNIPHRLRNEDSCEFLKNSCHAPEPPSSIVYHSPIGYNKMNYKGPDFPQENQDHNYQYHLNATHMYSPKIPAHYNPSAKYFNIKARKPLSKLAKKQNFPKHRDAFTPSPENCNKFVGFVQCETNSPFQLHNNSSVLSFSSSQEEEDIEESNKWSRRNNLPMKVFTTPISNCNFKIEKNNVHKKNYFPSSVKTETSTTFVNMDSYISTTYQTDPKEKLALSNWGEDSKHRKEPCLGLMIPNYLISSNSVETLRKLKLSENSQRKYTWCHGEVLDKLLLLTIGALYCVQPITKIREKNNRDDDLNSVLNLIFNKTNKEFLMKKIEVQNNSRRLLKVLSKYGLNDIQVSNIIKMFIMLYSFKFHHCCLNNLVSFNNFKKEDKKVGSISFLRIVRALSLKFIPKLLKQKKLNQIRRRHAIHISENLSQKFVSSLFKASQSDFVPERNEIVLNNLPKFNTSALSASEFVTNIYERE